MQHDAALRYQWTVNGWAIPSRAARKKKRRTDKRIAKEGFGRKGNMELRVNVSKQHDSSNSRVSRDRGMRLVKWRESYRFALGLQRGS